MTKGIAISLPSASTADSPSKLTAKSSSFVYPLPANRYSFPTSRENSGTVTSALPALEVSFSSERYSPLATVYTRVSSVMSYTSPTASRVDLADSSAQEAMVQISMNT